MTNTAAVSAPSDSPSSTEFNVYEYADHNDPDCTDLQFRQSFDDLREAHLYANAQFGRCYQIQFGLDGAVHNP